MTPLLSENAARDWVTPGEWRKGESYVRGLSKLTQRPAENGGTEYRAQAHGTENYRVSVTVQGGVVVASDCSCPIGHRCKHVAALLNKLTRADADFARLPALDAVLDALEEHELRRLLRRFLDKAPELEPLIYATAPIKSGIKSDAVSEWVPRIRAAFDLLPSGEDYEEWVYSEMELDTTELDEVTLELDRLCIEMSDWDEAQTEAVTRAYIALLDGIDDFYDGDIDYGLDDLQAEAVAGLYDIFTNADHLDSDLRDDALEALKTELVGGRLSFDDEFVVWFGVLTAAEQQDLRALLQKLAQSGDSYRRKKYLQALIDLRGGEPTEEETETMLRAEYSPVRLILFLLERGRIDEAVRETRQIRHRLPFNELQAGYQAAGALARLEQVAQQFEGYGKHEAQTWLCDLYASTGRRAEAYLMALKQAQEAPNMDWFRRLKTLSPQWETERDALIQRHWKTQSSQLLALLIAESLPDLAYQLVSRDHVSASDLQKVAALPALDAQRAALLYLRAGKLMVGGRNRHAYAQAAETLRALVPRLDKAEASQLILTHLPEYQKLPALRDELQKAGLI